jgi:tetratricopeptide (TPR) repeat protein
MGNFTVWHVYGMLNRSNKKFDDARKAFLNALRQDETNINVLRDLAILQLQLNDLEGHCESRRKMVVANSKIFAHFSGYLAAAFLVKDWPKCNEIWEAIEEIYGHNPLETEKINEITEIYLLRARTFLEMGNPKKGIKFIIKNTKYMVDDVRRNELLVKMYMVNN